MNAVSKNVPSGNGIVIVSAILLVLVLGGMIYLTLSNRPAKEIVIPDDTKVAREVLIQRFSGPEYFHLGESTGEMPHPYLEETQVRKQLERVTVTHKLSPAEVKQVEEIIAKLAEPGPSRFAGEERVNVLRLNLALDELSPIR